MIAAIIFLAVLWILVLRRQVKVQTAQIQNNAHQLQRQLEHEKELSEMKSRFVFTVSHEFRNPLAAIMSCSDVLQRTRGQISAEEHDIQISDIQQSVRRMADMMEEVLLLGRAEAGRMPCEPEPVDLHVFMLKLTDQISSASNGRCPIELTVDPQIPQQMMDPSLLQHILGNLISNAVKYSPPGMSVEVSVKPESGTVIFTIHDYGLGIPTLDRPRIFEPFQRGSNVGETAGTGLGLAIAERCARAHGGSISCESAAGEGTTFTVRLPSTAETTSP
ncbi:MAG: HAMP domain-containing sensor histidine kinase [Verrucomicrobia bacterium]|nr:HAMP domain-containing sensor histidine kinase [Verrucomicrobiota bacterium]